jgi:hypothetical protein
MHNVNHVLYVRFNRGMMGLWLESLGHQPQTFT